MKTCPNCKTQCEPGTERCPHCGAALEGPVATGGPALVAGSGRLTEAYSAPTQIALLSAQATLQGEGIPCVADTETMPWYDGLGQVMAGRFGRLLVREEDEDRARQIIEDLQRGGFLPVDT